MDAGRKNNESDICVLIKKIVTSSAKITYYLREYDLTFSYHSL